MLSRFSKVSIGAIGLVILSLSMAYISGGIINVCWPPGDSRKPIAIRKLHYDGHDITMTS